MTLRFTPPKEDNLPRYASYGRGSMKTHSGLNGAKASLRNRCTRWREQNWSEGFILELVEGEWYVLYHVKEGSKNDDLPWKKDVWRHKQYRWTYPTEPRHSLGDYIKERVNAPLGRDEYADWRVRVELERRGIDA